MLPMKRLVAVSCILIMLAAIFVAHDLCSYNPGQHAALGYEQVINRNKQHAV